MDIYSRLLISLFRAWHAACRSQIHTCVRVCVPRWNFLLAGVVFPPASCFRDTIVARCKFLRLNCHTPCLGQCVLASPSLFFSFDGCASSPRLALAFCALFPPQLPAHPCFFCSFRALVPQWRKMHPAACCTSILTFEGCLAIFSSASLCQLAAVHLAR